MYMKCLRSTMTVETATLVLAVFKLVITSLGSVVSVGGFIYMALLMNAINTSVRMRYPGELYDTVSYTFIFAILAVVLCIAFSFVITLIVGLYKRNANFVKCYFVYGATMLVIGVVSLIILNILFFEMALYYIPFYIMHVFYCPVLFMVRMTYKKFESEVVSNSLYNPTAPVQQF